jgi:hypothetical protein
MIWETDMAVDHVLSGELTALREELAASRRQRQPMHADGLAAGKTKAAPAGVPEDGAAGNGQLEELQELLNEAIKFVEDAGNNLSTHPVANVVSAFVVGIMIGRLFGRRQEL